MPKKKCPNGHIYDPSIYGDRCPLCPPPGQGGPAAAPFNGENDGHTHIGVGGTHIDKPAVSPPTSGMTSNFNNPANAADPTGTTKVRTNEQTEKASGAPAAAGHTSIRRPAAPGEAPSRTAGRKLVGFLVTYNRNPNGSAFNIYEGRNYIGRDSSCDICVPDDGEISGRHLSILYRTVDKKFKFRDEQSSNGTFVNKELLDEGELRNYDIIRVGGTLFIFIAIPI